MSGKEVQKWADEFMFRAEEIDANKGPEVWLLDCNNDPLGSIAAAAKAYKGEFVAGLHEITDEERRYYLAEVQKSALAMPLESVRFHFRIKGVTRGFTHQMVRQRTAAYSQESTRFAVKESVPVGLPPSLVGTKGDQALGAERDKEEYWRNVWDACIDHIEQAYNHLVNSGMPAEDARGLLPTNLLTQLNYFTNLRNYKDEAGKRLCTQAQFEWRIVFSKMLEAIREYGKTQTYFGADKDHAIYPNAKGQPVTGSSKWQFDALADLFRPICYYKGSCQFLAEFDRKCSIRDRVQLNATINRPSSKWAETVTLDDAPFVQPTIVDLGIPAIHPEEWLLDPSAAR